MSVDSSTSTTREPTTTANASRARIAKPRRRLLEAGERYALVALLVAVCIVFSLLPETRQTFPTAINLRQVLANQAAVTIIAVAEIFPLVSGSFDFSVGATSGISAVTAAAAMSRFGLPLWVAMLLGVILGTGIGALNGLLVAKAKLNAFVVTLGVATLLTGLVTWYTQGNNISTRISSKLTEFGTGTWLGIPRVLYLVAAVILSAWYLLGHTPFGRYVHALGSNARAAHLVGIAVPRHVFLCFLASGTLSGVAGVVMVARDGGAVIGEGPGLLFPALTAVFLGATAITPGRFNILGTVVGVVFIAASVSGLILAGAASWVNDVFNGCALVVAVAVSTFLGRQRRRSGT
jgi:ribose transport system permease protein